MGAPSASATSVGTCTISMGGSLSEQCWLSESAHDSLQLCTRTQMTQVLLARCRSHRRCVARVLCFARELPLATQQCTDTKRARHLASSAFFSSPTNAMMPSLLAPTLVRRAHQHEVGGWVGDHGGDVLGSAC